MIPGLTDWDLLVWGAEFGYPLSRPMLIGPGELRADVCDNGELCISGMSDQFAVTVPLAAVQALMEAHAAWLKATGEAEAEAEEETRDQTRN